MPPKPDPKKKSDASKIVVTHSAPVPVPNNEPPPRPKPKPLPNFEGGPNITAKYSNSLCCFCGRHLELDMCEHHDPVHFRCSKCYSLDEGGMEAFKAGFKKRK